MVERGEADSLTEVLRAVSDPTRRAILTLLVQSGPMRVTDLAGRFEMSLNSVSKHIKVLEKSGLVSRKTIWREHLIAPEIDAIVPVERWFTELRSIWDLRLDELDALMTKDHSDD